MVLNEDLRAIMARLSLKQESVAEILQSTSLDTVKGRCAALGSTRFRNMPEPMLRLLKYELKEPGLDHSLRVMCDLLRIR